MSQFIRNQGTHAVAQQNQLFLRVQRLLQQGEQVCGNVPDRAGGLLGEPPAVTGIFQGQDIKLRAAGVKLLLQLREYIDMGTGVWQENQLHSPAPPREYTLSVSS
ncbi:hypothetical protein D3C81_1711680 [compost metagenome]